MKKTLFSIFFVFAVLLVFQKANAQELYFCESVTDGGQPVGSSSVFNIPSGGGYFYFLVKLPYNVNCTYADYVIYKVDSYGNETYNTTISQTDLKANWTWFWKKVTFYDAGFYRIDVLDCSSSLLATKYLTINYK